MPWCPCHATKPPSLNVGRRGVKPRSFLEHFFTKVFTSICFCCCFSSAVFCGVFGKICFNFLWQCEVVQIPVTFLVIVPLAWFYQTWNYQNPNSSNIHIPVPEVRQGLHGPLSMLAPSVLNSNERWRKKPPNPPTLPLVFLSQRHSGLKDLQLIPCCRRIHTQRCRYPNGWKVTRAVNLLHPDGELAAAASLYEAFCSLKGQMFKSWRLMCINRCVYIYLSIGLCVYICLYIYVHVYIGLYICIGLCIHRSIYIYIYTSIFTCIYVYIYIYIYTCVYRCTNLYVYKSIYPHIIYIFVCFFEDSSLCAASRPQEALQGFDNSENTADSLPVFDGVKHPSIFSHDDSTESMTSNFFLISAVPYEQIFTRKKGGS